MDIKKIAKTFGPLLLHSQYVTRENADHFKKECPEVLELLLSKYNDIFLVNFII